MHYNRTVLPNGLRLIVVPMPSFESATVMVMVGAGSRYETLQNNGISHFLEHMAFKGTKKRPSALAISTLIDGIGGEFNAFTGKETTGYYIKSSSNHIDLCMDVLSDMLQHSLFDKAEIDKERGVILEEINLYEDTPARKIGDVYERLLYGNTPMGWEIAGEKHVIQKIQRDDFVDYMNSLYSASNITVVVSGGVSAHKAQSLSEQYFGQMSQYPTKQYVSVSEEQTKPEVMIRHKTTEQAHLALGVRTVPLSHSDKYPLLILGAILGGGMSSRLFSEVREKRGLAYYVRTSSDHSQDCGGLVTTAGVDPKRVIDAIKVIVSEYKKIASSTPEITKEELTKAKEFVKGHLVLELEDSRSVASFYASQELLEKHIETPENVLEAIAKVTQDEVETVARKYLINQTLNLALIGNFVDRQQFENLLQL